MLALSEIIDFLLTLMRDDNARADFEQDPQGSLARAGLEGITGQDVSDARLQLADSGAVHAGGHHAGSASSSYSDGSDAVHQINHTTQHYQASAPSDAGGDHGVSLEQQSNTAISIDDGDSFFFQTFNSDDDVTIIDDSFNTVDASSTDVTVTTIDGSFNSDDDVTAIDADNSFNTQEDNDVVAIQDNDTVNEDNDVLNADNSFNDVLNADNSFNDSAPTAPAAAVAPADVAPPIEQAPPIEAAPPIEQAPAIAEPAAEELVVTEPVVDASPSDVPFDDPTLDDAPLDDPGLDDPTLDDPTDDAGVDDADGILPV